MHTHRVSTIQMGLVMTQSHKYIIHPMESGAGEGSPHIMFNAKDWSMINGTTERIDGKLHSIMYYYNCDWASENVLSRHTKFDHMIQICCIIRN